MAICVDREKCIGCESCIAVCPVGALNMVDGKANIDQDTCIACGACIGNALLRQLNVKRLSVR